MDLRPSLPRRSPLESLNSNQRKRDNQNNTETLFSPGGGRTTRASSRKRKYFDDDEENMTPSCDIHSRMSSFDKQIDDARKRNAKPEKKKYSAARKKKAKLKKQTVVGRWEKWERFEFLRGLRRHGRGNWKKIGESIPTRSTIQVKTHAQVMMKKLEQGIDIFEELDNAEDKKEDLDLDINLSACKFSLEGTVNAKSQPAKKCSSEEARNSVKSQTHPRIHKQKSAFPLSNANKLPLESVVIPSQFQPVTTTTVTTTLVGNHNHNHRHEVECATHPNFNLQYHPYQFTPSFDDIARAASAAATVAASSALFPWTQHQFNTFQVPIVGNANQNCTLHQDFISPSQNSSKTRNFDLNAAEVEAIQALLSIRAD